MKAPLGRVALFETARPTDDDRQARFHVALAVGADGKLPTEFCMFRAGANATHDGRGQFLFDDAAAALCSAHIQERAIADFPIDYDHASLAFLSPDPAETAKAAGWFKAEIREGALWATSVEWTPKGAQKLRDREFRYFSPAVDWETTPEGGKRITKLINCALTNTPALAGLKPLVASTTSGKEPAKETTMKLLLKALGLSDTAAEAEALVALNAVQEHVRAILALSGKGSMPEAIGTLTGWKASAEQVAQLSAKVAEMEKAAAGREIDSLIDEAKRDGRLPPAHEKTAREVGATSVTALKAMLSVLPKLGREQHEGTGDGNGEKGTTTPTAEDRQVSAMLGIDPTKVAQMRAEKTTAAK